MPLELIPTFLCLLVPCVHQTPINFFTSVCVCVCSVAVLASLVVKCYEKTELVARCHIFLFLRGEVVYVKYRLYRGFSTVLSPYLVFLKLNSGDWCLECCWSYYPIIKYLVYAHEYKCGGVNIRNT